MKLAAVGGFTLFAVLFFIVGFVFSIIAFVMSIKNKNAISELEKKLNQK